MKELTGGCACGAVRYELATPPMWVNCCHCLDCQRQTGSAFAINAIIETDRIVVSGETPHAVRVPTDSGYPHDIYRCPICQTALWSDYGGRDWLRFVRVGTLDDKDALRPDIHIFTRSKRPWIALPPDVPAVEEYYDAQKLWPQASLERRTAAKAASESRV